MKINQLQLAKMSPDAHTLIFHCRKLPLILGLIGKFIYSSMIVVNTLQPSWPVNFIIYTATIPGAFTGADVAIFANAFSYISDITSVNGEFHN